MEKGFIVKINAGLYDVYDGQNIITCKARGKLRLGKSSPKVGDNVLYSSKDLTVDKILDRTNDLDRPPLANIDRVCVVASVANPYIQPSLINRYLILSELIDVKPVLILTKIDLESRNLVDELKHHYEDLGYSVYLFSSKTLEGLEDIKQLLRNGRTVFTGQSGSGKSTLINNLIPGSRQKTNDISKALGRGKHTTRIISYLKYEDGFIADTPGFSSIEFNINKDVLPLVYPGFDKYVGKCKFRDCKHLTEAGCKVKEDVSNHMINQEHYDTYVELMNSLKEERHYD